MFSFGWQGFALLAGGLFCVCLEVLIPTGGMLGIAAAACMGFGGYFAWQTGGPPALIGYSVMAVLLAPLTALSTLKILPHTPLGKRVILQAGSGGRATDDALRTLVGAQGTTNTSLRPSGIATIREQRIDVVTRGESIEAHKAVKVIHVEGNRVVVEQVIETR